MTGPPLRPSRVGWGPSHSSTEQRSSCLASVFQLAFWWRAEWKKLLNQVGRASAPASESYSHRQGRAGEFAKWWYAFTRRRRDGRPLTGGLRRGGRNFPLVSASRPRGGSIR